MQKLSRTNHGINFIFVAVGTQPLCLGAAIEKKVMEALRARKHSSTEMMKLKFCRPKSKTEPRSGLIRAGSFPENFLSSAERMISTFIRHIVKPNRRLLSETSDLFKAISFKFLHENNTDTYIENLQHFVNVMNCRVTRITKLAAKDVEKRDVPYVISLQSSNQVREPKYKIGRRVRITRKLETFLRGYGIQFTAEVFTITALQTLNPPAYSMNDGNNQLIQCKFYESELTLCEK